MSVRSKFKWCVTLTFITLEHLACNPDLVRRVYRPLATSKGNLDGPIFEEDGKVEANVRRPVVIQERDCCHQWTQKLFPRNDNPINVGQLKLECFLLHLNITTPKFMQCELNF